MTSFDEIEKLLQDADSFIDTVEELTGERAALGGLVRSYADLSSLQAAQLSCYAFLGSEDLMNPDMARAAARIAHRTSPVILNNDEAVVADVESFVMMSRLTQQAVYALSTTTETLGRVVYPLGVKRRTIGVQRLVNEDDDWAADTPIFRVRGRLDLGDVPVALVREDLLGAAVHAADSK